MSLKDVAYENIKNAIIDCVYLPGSFLSEREIIEELGISRTPFREAVNALSRNGLVEIIPHRGIFVTEITLKDVIDLYRIREQLEPFAVTLAMENVPDDVLETYYHTLKNSLNPANFVQKIAVEEDEDLHKMILRYSDNRLLTQMMEEIYDHNHRMRVLSTHSQSIAQITQEQHFEIIKHMRHKNVKLATEAMRQHVISSKDRALAAILKRSTNLNLKL